MNHELRFWKKWTNRDSVSLDSLSFSTWFWFLHVPGDPCNVLESTRCLELAWNVKISFEFFLKFLNMAMVFLQRSSRFLIRVCLHIYRGMELGQDLEQKSIELMIWSLIENQIFLHFHDWTKLPILEILHLWLWARNCQHIMTIFASQIDWKIKSSIFLQFKLIKWINMN